MLIWDIIRDWFVMNIWGGWASNGHNYSFIIGRFSDLEGNGEELITTSYYIPVGQGYDYGNDLHVNYICFGDWLSSTSTIIVLVAISVGLFYLTRYFFRMFAGLISGR